MMCIIRQHSRSVSAHDPAGPVSTVIVRVEKTAFTLIESHPLYLSIIRRLLEHSSSHINIGSLEQWLCSTSAEKENTAVIDPR